MARRVRTKCWMLMGLVLVGETVTKECHPGVPLRLSGAYCRQ